MEFEESSSKDEKALAEFCQALKTIQTRHTNVVQTMAQGVLELKDSHQVLRQKNILTFNAEGVGTEDD